MFWPMILLAISIAVPDEHTRLACLQTYASFCHAAAIGTAVDLVIEIVHGWEFFWQSALQYLTSIHAHFTFTAKYHAVARSRQTATW